MTPAQRKYDADLVASLRVMAQNILPRSRKLHDTFKLAADRIDALSAELPVVMPVEQLNQPASTSDPKSAPEPKQLEPMRD
jgi:hypothetical protein